LKLYELYKNQKLVFFANYSRYAVKSLMRVLGVSEDQLIMLRPREGEYILQTQDILKVIEVEKDNLALIMLPGVQYYTGQKLDMEAITR